MMRGETEPPRCAERLLAAALGASPYRDDILGDLHESYARSAASARLATRAGGIGSTRDAWRRATRCACVLASREVLSWIAS